MFRIISACLALAVAHSLSANSWQVRLDKAILDIDAKPQARFRLLQRAFNDPQLVDDINFAVGAIRDKGFGKGHPDAINMLWPEGTVARSDLEGLAALQKQLPELLKSLQEQAPSQASRFTTPTVPSIESKAVVDALFNLATSPEKQKELQNEAKNALRSTPKGLESPKYHVISRLDGPMKLGRPEVIEIRQYEAFTVARCSMDTRADGGDTDTPIFGTSASGTGFNKLAGYLFGRNEDNVAMAMTMPVEISTSSSASSVSEVNKAAAMEASMAFMLPQEMNEKTPPAPLSNDDVQIERIPERFVAVKSFSGIVTDEEVERQRSVLLKTLEEVSSSESLINEQSHANADLSSLRVIDPSAISVLQYNAPYTIPWRRRNEVAIVVELAPCVDSEKSDVELTSRNPWYDAGPGRGSWYDAGVRL